PLLVICVSVPPRQASLFPYTTLFRSSNTLPLARGAEPLGVALDIAARLSCVTDVCWRSWYPKKRWTLPSGDQTRGRPSELSPPQDRKSTRLNSSHVKISYAVFCLKKK